MQTPCRHCRCKKIQTSSRHEPKPPPKHHLDTSRKPPKPPAKTTLSRHLWNPHKTIFGATEHMPSLCKHHLDTADAKRPKHHQDTSRKPPKPQAKKLFHVTFGSHINKIKQSKTATEHNLWSHRAHAQPVQTPCRTLQMQKDPNIISTRAENRPNRKPKNSFTSPLEQSKTATEHNLWSHRAHAQPMQTPCRHCRCKKTQTPCPNSQNVQTSRRAPPLRGGSAADMHI